MKPRKVISTFTGMAGFDQAAEAAGFDVVVAVESDPTIQAYLKWKYPHVRLFGDITTVSGAELLEAAGGRADALIGGWPCQGNSVAGPRRGLNDSRSGLFEHFRRLTDEIKPWWVVGENVYGQLSVNKGQDFAYIQNSLAGLGRSFAWGCWSACDIVDSQGEPYTHNRKRLFCVSKLLEGRPTIHRDDIAFQEQVAKVVQRLYGGRGSLRHCPGNPTGLQSEIEDQGLRGLSHHESIPGPADLHHWQELLGRRPDLRPALEKGSSTELEVLPSFDGLSRKDALKMVGNAVVPAQAALVFAAVRHAMDLEEELLLNA